MQPLPSECDPLSDIVLEIRAVQVASCNRLLLYIDVIRTPLGRPSAADFRLKQIITLLKIKASKSLTSV